MTNSTPCLYGLIGYPVKHSLSPFMHNAAFAACGIEARYLLFEINPNSLRDFLLNDVAVKDTKQNSFSSLDILGFNVTIPYKIRTKEILQSKFPFDVSSSLLNQELLYVILSGAVNTVKRQKDRICYYNTDSPGFMKSLKEDLKFDTNNKKVLVMGLGGAGRAVIAGLSSEASGVARIYAYDISKVALESCRKHFSEAASFIEDFFSDKIEFVSKEDLAEVLSDCKLLVDATGVGLRKEDISVVSKELLHKDLSVYDLVYNKDTRLTRDARSIGCPVQGGLGMLLYQGALSFKIWTGKPAPVAVMRRALEEAVGR